jgi:vitamin B12 transporter
MPVTPIDTSQIVITASRAPEPQSQTPASVTIIDSERIHRLGEPLLPALLRLAPSAAVNVQGPSGTLTEVRIRGAEANHTLLFIDGIRANDPASGDTPRFELLNADLASRVEIVRGPQSALWGSDAIGGVIAVNGTADEPGYRISSEAGSFGFARASASDSLVLGSASLSGAVGWQHATGIDSFSGSGDKDGYRNFSGRLRGSLSVGRSLRMGFAAIALTGESDFDGYDPMTFEHEDTLDNSRNRLAAGRVWAELGNATSRWSGHVGATLLGSSNRNFLADTPVNRTSGTRRSIDAQMERRFTTGPIDQRLIFAAEADRESFHARDIIYGGFSNQDRARNHWAVTGEWRGALGPLAGDVAIRRDLFNRFADATTLRASLLADVGAGFAVAGSYSEGIAQPTFFDLYGFFPGNFIGNPNLKPESSRGFEGSLRFRRNAVKASLTAYEQQLHDEILDVFYPISTTRNSEGISHRRGIEAELSWQLAERFRISAEYAYLQASQPSDVPDRQLQELRRPRHSGSLAFDGSEGRWSYGGSIAYVGSHLDREEVVPFAVVKLDSYLLAGARVAFAWRPGLELFVRGSNLLNARYEDSAGYRTEGRGLFAGISLAGRRSSP